MTATTFVAQYHHSRAVPTFPDLGSRITSFLTFEADLLDEWRLEEWLGLFEPDGRYIVSPLQRLDEDPGDQNLCLISDDYERLQARIHHFIGATTWMEQPRSRTRRLVSNQRLIEHSTAEITAKANFVVYQFRNYESWEFVGSTKYKLVPFEATFRIRERTVQLDHESISKQRRISIII